MLVLNRKERERILIDGGRIVVTVLRVTNHHASIGIEAPADCRVHREEVQRRIERDGEAGPRKRKEAAGG